MSCNRLGWLPSSTDLLTGPPAFPCFWIQGSSLVMAPGCQSEGELTLSVQQDFSLLTSWASEKRGFSTRIFPTKTKQVTQAQQTNMLITFPQFLN